MIIETKMERWEPCVCLCQSSTPYKSSCIFSLVDAAEWNYFLPWSHIIHIIPCNNDYIHLSSLSHAKLIGSLSEMILSQSAAVKFSPLIWPTADALSSEIQPNISAFTSNTVQICPKRLLESHTILTTYWGIFI